MPEEVNRIVTDSIADILWTPSPDADENLQNEGVEENKIIRVGNIMIDSLEMLWSKIQNQNTYRELGLSEQRYALITLHRPSNVDDPQVLSYLCKKFVALSNDIKLVFPVHPQDTKKFGHPGPD